jgi:hypothetical protein
VHEEQQLLEKSADWWKYLPSLVAHTLIDNIWAYQQGKADGALEEYKKFDEDDDSTLKLIAAERALCALAEARVADLERQLRRRARGEKVEVCAGVAPTASRAGNKRARD